MDNFDDMFKDVGSPINNAQQNNSGGGNGYNNNQNGNNDGYNNNANYGNSNNNGGYNNGGNSYGNNNGGKKSFDNKPKYTNVEGKQTINVWNGDRVEPLELDYNSLRSNQKWVTFVVGNINYGIDDEHKKRIEVLAGMLKEKGFKCRIVCSSAKPLYSTLKSVFGDDIMHITPWKGYCKEMKDVKQYLSTDSNLKAASFYFNNKVKKYNDLPAGIKLVKSAVIGCLVGPDNNELSQIVIMHDRNYNGDRIDFKQSQQTSDYIMLAKPLSLNLYNVAMDKDYGDLRQLLSQAQN